MQPSFRKFELLQLLILGAAILLTGRWMAGLPDRQELGPRASRVVFEPARIDRRGFAPLEVAGAWALTGDDPRLGGVSALALAGDEFLALTDSGAAVRFGKPRSGSTRTLVWELPGGPGDPGFKSSRDSEALVRAPGGRGWWVGFETRNELWLYDPQLKRRINRVALGRKRWPRNRGIEGLSSEGDALLLFPEMGKSVLHVRGAKARSLSIENPAGRVSDAVRLPSGELLVLNRRLTPLGFVNSVAVLRRSAAGFRYGARFPLGLGPLDNAEALAAERLPDGRTRLWVMTDDNLQRPLRTLLIALDLPRTGSR